MRTYSEQFVHCIAISPGLPTTRGKEGIVSMVVIASLIFALALISSVTVIAVTLRQAWPRITEIIEMEFAPVISVERKVAFGEVKMRRRSPSRIIAFPASAAKAQYRLAA